MRTFFLSVADLLFNLLSNLFLQAVLLTQPYPVSHFTAVFIV